MEEEDVEVEEKEKEEGMKGEERRGRDECAPAIENVEGR